MITTEQEYAYTRELAAQFAARLKDVQAKAENGTASPMSGVATRSQLNAFRRELAMWEAGIREPVPGRPDLPEVAEDIDSQQATRILKQAEIAQIDRAIGVALDRIADWRRHRAWLEREIAALAAQSVVAS